MTDAFQIVFDSLLQRGAPLPSNAGMALRNSIDRFAGVLSNDTLEELNAELFAGLADIVKPRDANATPSETGRSLNARLLELARGFQTPEQIAKLLNLPFKIDVATRVMNGAGRFVNDQTDVDAVPAWELKRVYDRELPRGLKRSGKAVVPDPDNDWPHRWEKAASEIELAIFKRTGRMVALKSSGIWQALGDGVGGYTDTLGNPFPPFAFNSGFGVRGVRRREAIELGLMQEGNTARGTPFDFSTLISLPEAA